MTTIFGYGTGAVRRDMGARNTGFSWGGGSATMGSSEVKEEEGEAAKKKKGNKGKKQVLVQWG
jgi:hypothetical protein